MKTWIWLAGILTFFAATFFSHARQWTNDKGQVIEAEYVSGDDHSVELIREGKTFRYELSKLSVEDREYVKSRQKKTPPAAAVRTGWIDNLPISKPMYSDPGDYLAGSNAKAVYEAFGSGDFASSWSVNKKDAKGEFAYSDGKFTVYVPPSYDGSKPFGVYLHINAGPDAAKLKDFAPVMDKLGLIYVSPSGAGNKSPMLRRIKLAVDALATVRDGWKIDPARVCVGGISGGGHMAMLTHAMFPMYFVGSISHAAQSYLPDGQSGGHFPGLTARDLKSGEIKDHKWCVISGDKDSNYGEILATSELWKSQRFNYKFFDVPGMGHTNSSAEKLEEALRWVGVAEPGK